MVTGWWLSESRERWGRRDSMRQWKGMFNFAQVWQRCSGGDHQVHADRQAGGPAAGNGAYQRPEGLPRFKERSALLGSVSLNTAAATQPGRLGAARRTSALVMLLLRACSKHAPCARPCRLRRPGRRPHLHHPCPLRLRRPPWWPRAGDPARNMAQHMHACTVRDVVKAVAQDPARIQALSVRQTREREV